MENIRILNRMKDAHGHTITLNAKASEATGLSGVEIKVDGDIIKRIAISKSNIRHYILGVTEHSQHHGVVYIFFTIAENGELNYLGVMSNDRIEHNSDISYIAEQVERELSQYVSVDDSGNVLIERKQ